MAPSKASKWQGYTPLPLPPLSATGLQEVAAMKAALKDSQLADLSAADAEFLSEATFERYYRAYEMKKDVALTRLQGTLEWRRANVEGPCEMCEGMEPTLTPHLALCIGEDAYRRPVLFSAPGRWRDKTAKALVRHFVDTLDSCLDPLEAATCVCVADMRQFSLLNSGFTKETIIELSGVFGHHYPDRLSLFVILEPSILLDTLISIIKPFLDPVTARKIVVAKAKDIDSLTTWMFGLDAPAPTAGQVAAAEWLRQVCRWDISPKGPPLPHVPHACRFDALYLNRRAKHVALEGAGAAAHKSSPPASPPALPPAPAPVEGTPAASASVERLPVVELPVAVEVLPPVAATPAAAVAAASPPADAPAAAAPVASAPAAAKEPEDAPVSAVSVPVTAPKAHEIPPTPLPPKRRSAWSCCGGGSAETPTARPQPSQPPPAAAVPQSTAAVSSSSVVAAPAAAPPPTPAPEAPAVRSPTPLSQLSPSARAAMRRSWLQLADVSATGTGAATPAAVARSSAQ